MAYMPGMLVCWLRGEPMLQAAVGGALVIDPQAAHRVMDGGENFHRRGARIDARNFS